MLDETPGDALTDELKAHLEECAGCHALADALGAVDDGLASLPTLQVSEELLARTLERVEAEREPERAADVGAGELLFGVLASLMGGLWALAKLALRPWRTKRGRRLGLAGLGIAFPAVAALGLVMVAGSERDKAISAAPVSPQARTTSSSAGFTDQQQPLQEEEVSEGEVTRAEAVADEAAYAPPATVWLDRGPADRTLDNIDAWDDGAGRYQEHEVPTTGELERGPTSATTDGRPAYLDTPAEDLPWGNSRSQRAGMDVAGDTTVDQSAALGGAQRDLPAPRSSNGANLETTPNADEETNFEQRDTTSALAQDLRSQDAVDRVTGVTTSNAAGRAELEASGSHSAGEHDGDSTIERNADLDSRDDGASEATRFLAERDRVDGLSFRDATGYWASTYVPGDPELRLLRRRLAATPEALALAERAEPGDLALDPPAHGAIALHVNADRAAVEGRSRVLVSVGLRGAVARAGRRPTLRAEVVIDARQPLDDEAQARVRALLMALSRSRQGADRIGVLVAGPNGGELLPLGALRFGELTVALRRLSAGGDSERAVSDTSAVTLDDAVRQAMASVGQLQDASSPLASAMVLVVSPSLSDADARALEPVVHMGTMAGVTTTALGLSDAAALDPLERIALAGQGRRRVLASIDGAEALVRSEVEAVSRVVARAVRLRIRLAPGVSLVDVIGSRPLGTDETRRVRQAEDAVDRRLARQLGIVADRGHDDDGIQIVMPAFYAGDAHAVLLDLVVPGPGPVADVSLQMKDLIRLENGTASARVTLARGARPRGPRERQVLGELLGHEIARALRDAARSLNAGDVSTARARLEAARRLAVGLRGAVRMPASDASLLSGFATAIHDSADRASLVSSLRYASRIRLEGAPLAIDGN